MIRNSIILLFLFQYFLTTGPVVYKYQKKGKEYTLKLFEDSTYIYTHPSDVIPKIKTQSGYSVMSEYGKWRIDKDSLVIIDSAFSYNDKTEIIEFSAVGQQFVSVVIVDEKNNPLYSYEVALNSDSNFKKTDSLGCALFSFKELKKLKKNQSDKTIERIECRKENFTSYLFDLKNVFSNRIKIILDQNPINKKEIRIRKLPIVKNKLIFKNPSGYNETLVMKLEKASN